MPVGKWKTFGMCVAAHRKKGHDEESARKICGSIQAKMEHMGKSKRRKK